MDKDKFYKPNEKDMTVMKKIHHHHMASMNHSTGSPEHKHHIQQVMKHKSQLSKDAQKLLMMGEGTYKVEIEGLPKMYMDTDNPGELRRDLRKIVRKVDMVKNVERVQKSQVRKDLQLKIQGKDDMEEMTMGQGVEVKKTAVGDRPKGYGWSLKKSGQQTGKDHDVWHRQTKGVVQPRITTRSPMFNSKNESFFFVKEDQIKRDGAKIKKAYDAIATEDMNVITKHLKKQGIEHDHDKGELYVKRQDHRDVMNHLSDLMKKKMIKSKPPVTTEKLDEIKGTPRTHAKTYSKMNLDKAKKLMSPAKHRQDGIDRIAKGMNISKAKATKHHDDVMKSYGFKTEDKGRGPTGIAYSLPKGHPDAENPATRKKYPERQTDKYKADFAKNSPLKLSGKFSKNESVDEIVTRRGKPVFQPKPDDSPERTAMIKSVQKSLNKRRERLAKAKKDRQAAHAQGKPFDTLKALGYGKAVEANEEKKKKTGLAGKAEKSGMPLGILKTVYNRGMAAWKTGHRPGTTPQQWGHARVNSFITKSSGTWGKADKDLADKVRARKK
tara:strand:+ start:185 stop:1837 length:1653 start_codon:yes stop_codon:yes gene_type:complete